MSDAIARLNAALEGRYAIERELGEGGMATVYLADDLKHERKVALKVLKPELAAVVGAERFLAEIKTTANLTHPNILPLHDSGEADSFLFYVMPYLAGETLQDRIDREKQLPVDEAVRIATAVANALDHAHRNKVIHRDIKPANILLQDGEPVVADFGIALAVGAGGGDRLTETGLSLGTPFYMSPEQATGDQFVGSSTDTYALGAVLYEMLTGDPPYMGSTAQAVLGQIISSKAISASEKRPSIPGHVDAALRKALEKLPADRFASAQEFARALGDPGFRYGEVAATGAAVAVGPWKRLSMSLAGTTLLLGAFSLWMWLRPGIEVSLPVTALVVDPPPGHQMAAAFPGFLPDGRHIVFFADSGGVRRVYVRALDGFGATPITGAERPLGTYSREYIGAGPVIPSPDGDEIAFVAGDSLLRVLIDGTEDPLVITESLDVMALGGSWGDDGSIVFSPDLGRGLMRVPAGGGTPEVVTVPDTDAGEIGHAWPDLLPGGRAIVFSVLTDAGWAIAARSLGAERHEIIIPDGGIARFMAPKYLVYSRSDALLVVEFDPVALKTVGSPRQIVGGLPTRFAAGRFPFFSVSRDGSLSYVTGEDADWEFVLISRDGARTVLQDPAGLRPRFSPDGKQVLADRWGQIWIYDLSRGGVRTLFKSGAPRFHPTMTPDGSRIAVSSYEAGVANLAWISTSRSDDSEMLLVGENRQYPDSWSPNGTLLAFREESPETGSDIWVLPVEGDRTPVPVVVSEFDETSPRFSPDGRWLAYMSDRSGRNQVYVQGYPEAGRPQLVSVDGGTAPAWASAGRELFFRNGDLMMVVEVTPGDPPQFGQPRALFEHPFPAELDAYDVSPDGQHIITAVAVPDPPVQLRVLINFVEALKGRVPN